MGSLGDRWRRYWFEPVPERRFAWFTLIIYATVLFTVLWTDRWAAAHSWAPGEFYQPIRAARAVGLAPPTAATMLLVQLFIVAGVAGTGISAALEGGRVGHAKRRLARLASLARWSVFAGYGVWLAWAFSYSKVDHDRLTILVALAVIAAVRLDDPRDTTRSNEIAGWALRTVQVVFVLAYPLSAISKLRASGTDWMNSAVFARAIVRRGTLIGDQFLARPSLLVAGQWIFIAFELAAVLALSPNRRVRNIFLAGIVGLHLFTYLAIGINFLPHVVCITAFFPLERLGSGGRLPSIWGSSRTRRSTSLQHP